MLAARPPGQPAVLQTTMTDNERCQQGKQYWPIRRASKNVKIAEQTHLPHQLYFLPEDLAEPRKYYFQIFFGCDRIKFADKQHAVLGFYIGVWQITNLQC